MWSLLGEGEGGSNYSGSSLGDDDGHGLGFRVWGLGFRVSQPRVLGDEGGSIAEQRASF